MIKTIDEILVKSFSDNIRLRFQQMMGRVWQTFDLEPGIVGEQHFFDLIEDAEAQDKVQRNADTVNIQHGHERTRCSLTETEWATLIDKEDKLKLLGDPTSRYIAAGIAALHRKMDSKAITALSAIAYRGKEGSTAVPFDTANQQIVHASAGLNFGKIKEAKAILDAAEVPVEDRFFLVSSHELNENILSDSEIKSRDYESLRALVEGKDDTFLNFKFIRTELLPVSGNIRSCFAYQRSAMGWASGIQGVMTDLSIRNDKSNAAQPYAWISCGASRIQDKGVIEVQCDKSA